MAETTPPQGFEEEPNLTQGSYTPTAYADSSWEIVGQRIEDEGFVSMSVPVLPSDAVKTDPMFQDYGGTSDDPNPTRWHLPKHLSRQATSQASKAEEEAALAQRREAELNAQLQRAFEKGKREGLEEAVGNQNERLGVAEKRISEILQDFRNQLGSAVRNTEQEALKLALHISRKILGSAVEINPEYILPIIKEGLRLAGTATVRSIRVSPQDLEFLKLAGVHKMVAGTEDNWEFIGDGTIRAGCVVDTSAGEVDFQLDKAWERIEAEVVKITR